MARGWSKFGLLLWKNYVLQKRHVIQTAVEVLVPVLLSMLLVLIRTLVDPERVETSTYFTPFQANVIPALGPLPPPFDKKWSIVWSPKANLPLQDIMAKTAVRMRMDEYGFDTSAELVSYLTSPLGPSILTSTLCGVIFEEEASILNDTNGLPVDLTMRFRFPGESRFSLATVGQEAYNVTDSASHLYSWWTNFIYPLFQVLGPRQRDYNFGGQSPGYWIEQFLSLQETITHKLINHLNSTFEIPFVELQRFPYPPYLGDPILQALEGTMSTIILLSFVYSCISIVKVITTEKEKQLKEAMKIMGLPNWLHWVAWFIKTFTFLLVTIILITILLKIPWYPGADYSVFTNSDATVLFVFLMLYIINTIMFCFMISVFFSKANTASTVAGLIWFISFVPYSFMYPMYTQITTSSKIAACLAGNTAMAYGFQLMIMQEGSSQGTQWSNLWVAPVIGDDFVLGHIFLMFILDSIIYLLIALYVEAVFPGDFGVPQPWNYFMKKSFWFGNNYSAVQYMSKPAGAKGFENEAEPTHLNAGIRIQQLTKQYGVKTAVDDLNLNMYEGQITVLLGHNGAGKTTTMSMLTGMITPSEGTAIVNGYDIRNNIQNVRESLGLCPQHNVLFEELTVREHLYFFGKLKGLDGDALEKEIMKYITLMELLPKENKMSSTLSGGMQRKLAACIALCGNSKVVMFDEPTSGMDPTARRALWDLLQLEKKGRTMLLSTHFMDEADLLGDRIAIMAGGQLQCVGSSFFLKKKYGEGYRLVIVKDEDCDVTGVTQLLRRFIPGINVGQNIGTELSYLLKEDLSSIFEEMFKELEENKQQLRILSYGMSLTTMEEVFMKAGKDKMGVMENSGAQLSGNNVLYNTTVNTQNGNTNGNIHSEDSLARFTENPHLSTTKLDISSGTQQLLSGFDLSKNQLWAMFVKKAIYTKRSWILTAIQTFLPIFFLALTFVIVRTWSGYANLPALPISIDHYGEYFTTVNSLTTEPESKEWYDAYVETYPTGLTELAFGANMSNYILEESLKDLAKVSLHYIVGASFDWYVPTFPFIGKPGPKITAYFNNQPLHTPPLTMNMVYNMVLKKAVSKEHNLQIINHPLPFTDNSKFSQLAQGDNMGYQIAFNMAFSMAFVTAFYVLFTVRERESKAKLLQFVSGVEVLTFWGSALIWDLVTFLLPVLGILIVMIAFQEDGFSSGSDLGRHLLILLLFNWASMPLMYLFSFLFTIPATGYTRVTMFNIIGGVALFMTVTILEYPLLELTDTANVMDQILLVVPHYNLAMSFRTLFMAQAYGNLCKPVVAVCGTPGFVSPCCTAIEQCGPAGCISWVENYFSFVKPGIGRHLVYFTVDGFVFIAILLLVEYKVFDKIVTSLRGSGPNPGTISTETTAESEDFDVAEEKHKIRNVNPNDGVYSLLLRDVSKFYGNFQAVNQICVGIKKGECFGLLGVNGAGKTTTFKMMTGDETISSGDAYVNGYSLRTNMKQVHQLIGYCPQFDALIDDLTGRETLTMFCLLRGVPRKEVPYIVDQLANELLFTQHIDKKVKEYSGGNKRKLSTAVALVGDPPVVYLDEPTTGMDPVAKRHLWNVICKVRDSGKVIVLTSHSMEECEALCTRSAIMVNGNFKCLGSTQHLKNKFAEGYTLNVKVKRPPGEQTEYGAIDATEIKQHIHNSFPGSVLREEFQGLLSYYIQNPTISWSKMFGMMELAKQKLNIEDYALGQTSLEQVFLAFTRTQREEIG